MVEVFQSSEKALDKSIKRNKYPWDILKVGESFSVDKNTVKKHSLICMVGQTSLKKNKRFIVIDHGENTTSYEVARVE